MRKTKQRTVAHSRLGDAAERLADLLKAEGPVDPPPGYFSVSEIAMALGISVPHAHRMLTMKRWPRIEYKVQGRRRMFVYKPPEKPKRPVRTLGQARHLICSECGKSFNSRGVRTAPIHTT